MDRSALIQVLLEEVKIRKRELGLGSRYVGAMEEALTILEADAQKEASLKALCDERAKRLGYDAEIRDIYGWREEGK